jgi:aryl-alcohol dehydrogenase-like predicted oxidoreductase
MTFGDGTGWGMDDAHAAAVFDLYIERGGNFFDTAISYQAGSSEIMLGKFVRDRGLRGRAVIATKFTRSVENGNPNAVGNGRKNVQLSLELSLKRLQTDYIDLYWMHSWDMVTPVEEVIGTFDDLVRAGKIRYYGLSDVPAWYAARAQTLAEKENRNRIAALQLEYSLIERSIEREHLPAMQEMGMALCAWGATSSGFLSGKYQRDTGPGTGQGRLSVARQQYDRFGERAWRILDAVLAVSKELGKSPAQIALNWVINQPGSTSPIVGVSSTQQLKENLAAMDFVVPLELRQRLAAVSAPELGHPYNMYKSPISQMIGGGVSTRAWTPSRQ